MHGRTSCSGAMSASTSTARERSQSGSRSRSRSPATTRSAFGTSRSARASRSTSSRSSRAAKLPVRGRAYGPGAPTDLERGGPPGTFGTERRGDEVRIVWRFQAANETRTFSLRYRIRGLAVAYDDVVDVNLKVWGDEWEQPLGRLTAAMTGPGRVVRAWGHPVWVRGDVTLAGNQALLRAVEVPARQFVELRTL